MYGKSRYYTWKVKMYNTININCYNFIFQIPRDWETDEIYREDHIPCNTCEYQIFSLSGNNEG